MARQIGFHLYTVRVREKRSRTYEILSSLKQQDLLPLLRSGMRRIQNAQTDDQEVERVACLKRVEISDRSLTGLIEAGHYGETLNIVHSKTGETKHVQNTDEASMLPCFFRMVIPEGANQGLLILQRDNRVQSKGAFKSIILPMISALDENFACEIEPIMTREAFEKLVGDGDVQQVKFIRLSITEDFADEYDKGKDETEGSMELIVKARRGRGLPFKNRIREWMTSGKSVSDLFVVPGLDFEFDTVKVDLRIGRNKRTLDFGKKLSNPIIDLTEKVERDRRTGHPTYASLLSATEDLAHDAMVELYGE